ncbi:unnamed protein product [Closterium sp. Naga37s-1]|nr:unnamed protein product [Closterium sp. Naga37s-1]
MHAANPREEAMRGWCHLRVRYLYQRVLSSVSRMQVAEMRGDMAVLSDAATGTTILLALPMGGGEDADSGSMGGGDWDEENGGERDGCGTGREGECVEFTSVAIPGMQEQPSVQQEQASEQQQQQQQQQAARTHSRLKPRVDIFKALERPGEAEGVLPVVAVAATVAVATEEPVPAVGKAGRRTAWSHLLPKPHSNTEGLGDAEGEQVRAVGVSGRRTTRAHSLPRMQAQTEAAEEAEVLVRAAVAGWSVAVVDDNAVNHMVARRTLQGYRAHVLLLPSGEDAIQALSSASPSAPIHLPLLDLHMPHGIDG